MSESYIRTHFDDIRRYANAIETRLDDEDCTIDSVLKDNARTLALAKETGIDYTLIDGDYRSAVSLP